MLWVRKTAIVKPGFGDTENDLVRAMAQIPWHNPANNPNKLGVNDTCLTKLKTTVINKLTTAYQLTKSVEKIVVSPFFTERLQTLLRRAPITENTSQFIYIPITHKSLGPHQCRL